MTISVSPSSDETFAELIDKRIVLVTGKGGVGRTSITAALARIAADAGRRVLVTEIGEPGGDYSPLARLYGRDTLPAKPEQLEPGVCGSLLWSKAGHTRFLESVLPVPALVKAGMRSKALGRLLDAAPSFQEMGVFYHLLTLLKKQRPDGEHEHELVILDMPATGHTLALTGLPSILLKILPTGPIADLLRQGQAMLNNPATGAACVVTLPETLPVSECLELLDGLRATRMPVGVVLVNRVINDPFTAEERAWLGPILASRPVVGAARFHSAAETERSLERLRRHARVPVCTLPEFPFAGADLIRRLSAALTREEAA